jgi:hypothetical protein
MEQHERHHDHVEGTRGEWQSPRIGDNARIPRRCTPQHPLRPVGGDDQRSWCGPPERWQQSAYAGAKIEHPMCRSERQTAQQLSGSGVQRRCPPLLVCLRNRGVVRGQRLNCTATRGHNGSQSGQCPSPGWIPSSSIVIPFVGIRRSGRSAESTLSSGLDFYYRRHDSAKAVGDW